MNNYLENLEADKRFQWTTPQVPRLIADCWSEKSENKNFEKPITDIGQQRHRRRVLLDRSFPQWNGMESLLKTKGKCNIIQSINNCINRCTFGFYVQVLFFFHNSNETVQSWFWNDGRCILCFQICSQTRRETGKGGDSFEYVGKTQGASVVKERRIFLLIF